MKPFSSSNGTSKLVHSANGTEYQSHESRMAYRAINGSHIGIGSHVPSNSVKQVFGNSTVTNEQRQVISTSYNGSASIKLDVNSLLQLIANILQVERRQRAITVCSEQKTTTMIPGLSQLIHKVTDEIWCDCAEKGNAHQRACSLLDLLSNYSPDEMVVLVLAAFAIRYGDVRVTMNQHNESNNMVKSLVHLKQLTGTLEGESTFKPQIEDIKDTVNIVLDIVDYITELKGFHNWDNILSEINIEEIIVLMVTAVIHCGFTVSEFYSGYSLSLNERTDRMITRKKIQDYRQELTTNITIYREREAEIQVTSNYQELFRLLRFPPTKNIDILCYFISSSIDGNILYNPGLKEQTTLRSFQESKVLILYSSFASVTFQEESVLQQLYNNTNTKFGCKIVWVPIDIPKTTTDDEYSKIISQMSYCYTLTYEAVQQVNLGLVHLLKKDWGFTGKPMLVVLDERGRVVCQNALLMLHLYGHEAFPFTTEHENQLLENKSIGIHQLLLQDVVDTTISQWIKSEQYVCLYGGPDIKWCEIIGKKLKTFKEKGKIKVETAYIGRNSHHKEKVEERLTSFREANLGYSMEYSDSTVFWERLQKFMLHFSTHHSRDVSKGFLSWASPLLTLDKSKVSWVAIGDAYNVQVFTGSVFLSGLDLILMQFNKWNSEVTTDNFLEDLSRWMNESKKNQRNEKHCHKLEIAGSPALIRGDKHCPTCNEPMQMMVLYKCCTTENSI